MISSHMILLIEYPNQQDNMTSKLKYQQQQNRSNDATLKIT